MAKIELIRKNIITSNYEHLVLIPKENGTYTYQWSPGFTGLEWISNELQTLNQIQRGEIQLPRKSPNQEWQYIVSYEDYSANVHGKYEEILSKKYISWQDYIEKNDIGIRELIDNINPIVHINLNGRQFNNSSISILSGAKSSLALIATNPVYGNSMDLLYRWELDGEVISKGSVLDLSKYHDMTGKLQGVVTSKDGETRTDNIEIKIININQNPLFNRNIIKNGDAKTNLSGWDIIYGNPEAIKIGVWANQQSDMYYDDAWYNREWLGSYGEKIEPFGPPPSEILNGTPENLNKNSFYFRGGVAGEKSTSRLSSITIMKQEIDISSAEDIIDRKINGINDVYGTLFGWLGNMGQATGLTSANIPSVARGLNSDPNVRMSWNSIVAIYHNNQWINKFLRNILILDKIYIEVKLFDASEKEINSEYIMYSPIHMGEDFKFFLRTQYIYIPIGTRKIEVIAKFHRSNNAIYSPFDNSATNSAEPLPSQLIKWGRWNSDNQTIEQVHSGAFTNLNLILYANDNDMYYDKLKKFNDNIYFRQYEMVENLLDKVYKEDISDTYLSNSGNIRISTIANFSENVYGHSNSAIHLKVRDLFYHFSKKHFNEIYTNICGQSWFNRRFSKNQIWNAIIDGIEHFSLPISLSGINKKQCAIQYYDFKQHYTVSNSVISANVINDTYNQSQSGEESGEGRNTDFDRVIPSKVVTILIDKSGANNYPISISTTNDYFSSAELFTLYSIQNFMDQNVLISMPEVSHIWLKNWIVENSMHNFLVLEQKSV